MITKFRIHVIRDEIKGGYVATSPELFGLSATGATIAEAHANFQIEKKKRDDLEPKPVKED